MKKFLKSVQLLNGGYLSDADGSPVSNQEFEYCQRRAEYVVTFAEMAKGKNFKECKADSLELLKKQVSDKLYSITPVQFVTVAEAPERPVTDQLAAEAMSFMDFHENSTKAAKINEFLQEFTPLNDFETFGLFFEQDVVKLNKLYTMNDIISAVNEVIDLIS